MKKCKIYDCTDGDDMQKKVGDQQREDDERNTKKSADKSPEKWKHNCTIANKFCPGRKNKINFTIIRLLSAMERWRVSYNLCKLSRLPF